MYINLNFSNKFVYHVKFLVFGLVRVEDELMFLHRGRVDIIADILIEAAEGTKKTHVMYRCNLSFRQLQTYLDFLLYRGLLETLERRSSGSSRLLRTTAKGQAFLRAYRNLKVLLAP